MGNYSEFTNLYSQIKNVPVTLKPVGATREWINRNRVLDSDAKRLADKDKVTDIMDDYYRNYINKCLLSSVVEGITEYAEAFTEGDTVKAGKIQEEMQKTMAQELKSTEVFQSFFNAHFVKDILLPAADSDETKELLASFIGYDSIFADYRTKREVLFDGTGKAGSVAARMIKDNLPIYIANTATAQRHKGAFEMFCCEIDKTLGSYLTLNACYYIQPEQYSMFLTQAGIDDYNTLIGGISKEDGTKIKGLNEWINEYNQIIPKGSVKIRPFKRLKKQMLTQSISLSFIPAALESDDEAADLTRKVFCPLIDEIDNTVNAVRSLSKDVSGSDIFISTTRINSVSHSAYGSWDTIENSWKNTYMLAKPKKPSQAEEKYTAAVSAEWKKVKNLSIEDIENITADEEHKLKAFLIADIITKLRNVQESYKDLEKIIRPQDNNFKLKTNRDLIKQVYDDATELKNAINILVNDANTAPAEFTDVIEACYDQCWAINKMLNRVRAHLTKKPYEIRKMKLLFDNGALFGGVAESKLDTNGACYMVKDGKYYLLVASRTGRKLLKKLPPAKEGEEAYNLIAIISMKDAYMSLPKSTFRSSRVEVPDDVRDIFEKGTWKNTAFVRKDFEKIVEYYMWALTGGVDTFDKYNFHFDKPASEFRDINDFYAYVDRQGKGMEFKPVTADYIDTQVREGIFYLFEIYTHDFSEAHHGRDDWNTMFLRMAFAGHPRFQLLGGSEIFYRPASLKMEDTTVHKAGFAMDNKNPDSVSKSRTLYYDIVKDRRFTEEHFSLHVCLKINPDPVKMPDRFNRTVNSSIISSGGCNILAIARGERSLIDVCVINPSGEILEQRSLDVIKETAPTGAVLSTDYRSRLVLKADERTSARKDWDQVPKIEGLRKSFIGKAIHEITMLMRKYDAVVCIEYLSDNFKDKHSAIESSVYKTFEQALRHKMQHLAYKDYEADVPGSAGNAYQLVSDMEFRTVPAQDGFLFSLSAAYTGGMDPVTGFIAPYFGYETRTKAAELFGHLKTFGYSEHDNMYFFSYNAAEINPKKELPDKEWTVWTNGYRVKAAHDPEHSNKFRYSKLNLTAEFDRLFETHGIAKSEDMLSAITSKDSAVLYKELFALMNLTVQMRNYDTDDIDYFISPVRADDGSYFNSSKHSENGKMPYSVNAVTAYNMARKCLFSISRMISSGDVSTSMAVSSDSWINARWGTEHEVKSTTHRL